jgi:hypothetical protein
MRATISPTGLKVLRDLCDPQWRLRVDYIRTGHYVMQWRSWPDTAQYQPPPAVIKQLLNRGYIERRLEDGEPTDWYNLTDAGRALIVALPVKVQAFL